ncbi:zinc finger CCCH domain-containing protein 10 [Caerostris extrusa]|uniref:Zinc finger CCCH domain-containing protein 10 n=1 Tax=Caerostris extrusa TaxID=172846 RepID=A0AAV4SIU0_CAEEX|nr:zinc finger CCCH domain-containing protein 10 [Caerostris extrusa]
MNMNGDSMKDNICRDFLLRNVCNRGSSCKFRHPEGDEAKALESVNQKGGQVLPTIPVCKDYLKGECKRGGRCKFRHITSGQYHMENNNLNPPRGPPFENFEPQLLMVLGYVSPL